MGNILTFHTTQLTQPHPILCWLPSKLAVWLLAENLGQELSSQFLLNLRISGRWSLHGGVKYDLGEQLCRFWP